jgi:hypothetical protein
VVTSSCEFAVAGLVLAHAVAVAIDVHDDGAVQEPVEHRGGDGGVIEDRAQAPTSRLVPGSPDFDISAQWDSANGGICPSGSETVYTYKSGATHANEGFTVSVS